MNERLETAHAMLPLSPWFRVEFSPGGRVLSCVQCSSSSESKGRRVVYVQAHDIEMAKLKAAAIRARLALDARRIEYDAKGLCRCGRERSSDGYRTCDVCRERNARDYKKSMKVAKQAGITTLAARRSPGLRQRARRADVRQMERHAVLLEVQTAYHRFLEEGRGSFVRWLDKQIKKAGATP